MRNTIVVTGFVLLVAAGVWYMVRELPRLDVPAPSSVVVSHSASPSPSPSPSPSSVGRTRDTQSAMSQAAVAVDTPPRRDTARGPPMPALGSACGGHCGTERWAVKTLSDPDRLYVRLTPVDATIEQLVTVRATGKAPGGFRVTPVETTVYRVEGYLAGAYPEDDGDWHLALFGLENQRVSLIAEIPDPSCDGSCRSGFAGEYAAARQVLAELLRRPNPRDKPIVVRVTGVGFFDREHGQKWAAPNGLEIHPVLAVELVR